jgi:hypothetical protein
MAASHCLSLKPLVQRSYPLQQLQLHSRGGGMASDQSGVLLLLHRLQQMMLQLLQLWLARRR